MRGGRRGLVLISVAILSRLAPAAALSHVGGDGASHHVQNMAAVLRQKLSCATSAAKGLIWRPQVRAENVAISGSGASSPGLELMESQPLSSAVDQVLDQVTMHHPGPSQKSETTSVAGTERDPRIEGMSSGASPFSSPRAPVHHAVAEEEGTESADDSLLSEMEFILQHTAALPPGSPPDDLRAPPAAVDRPCEGATAQDETDLAEAPVSAEAAAAAAAAGEAVARRWGARERHLSRFAESPLLLGPQDVLQYWVEGSWKHNFEHKWFTKACSARRRRVDMQVTAKFAGLLGQAEEGLVAPGVAAWPVDARRSRLICDINHI